jgi:hypothetical protein
VPTKNHKKLENYETTKEKGPLAKPRKRLHAKISHPRGGEMQQKTRHNLLSKRKLEFNAHKLKQPTQLLMPTAPVAPPPIPTNHDQLQALLANLTKAPTPMTAPAPVQTPNPSAQDLQMLQLQQQLAEAQALLAKHRETPKPDTSPSPMDIELATQKRLTAELRQRMDQKPPIPVHRQEDRRDFTHHSPKLTGKKRKNK